MNFKKQKTKHSPICTNPTFATICTRVCTPVPVIFFIINAGDRTQLYLIQGKGVPILIWQTSRMKNFTNCQNVSMITTSQLNMRSSPKIWYARSPPYYSRKSKGKWGRGRVRGKGEGPRENWEKVQVLLISRGVGVFPSRVIRDEYRT